MGRGNKRRRRVPRLPRALRRSRGLVLGAGVALLLAALVALLTPPGRALVARIVAKLRGAEHVTIPEGFNRFEIAARLAARGVCDERAFLEATTDRALLAELHVPSRDAEGWLFPDTYDLPRGTPPDEVVRRLVARFRERAGPLVAQAASERDTVVLASIVEREAVMRDEQPIIAGVFVNRMRDPTFVPHRLQSDPTVAYGCLAVTPPPPTCPPRGSPHLPRVSHAMTTDALNPYNTYRIEGLPPGAIASPGLDALRAALRPATHDYLYFVARGHGRHAFSRTLAEHNAHVDALRAP